MGLKTLSSRATMGRKKKRPKLAEDDVPLPTEQGWHVLLDANWERCSYLPDDLTKLDVGRRFTFGDDEYYYELVDNSTVEGAHHNVGRRTSRKIRFCGATSSSSAPASASAASAPASSSQSEIPVSSSALTPLALLDAAESPESSSERNELKEWWRSTKIGMEYWASVKNRFSSLEDVRQTFSLGKALNGATLLKCIINPEVFDELELSRLGQKCLLAEAIHTLCCG